MFVYFWISYLLLFPAMTIDMRLDFEPSLAGTIVHFIFIPLAAIAPFLLGGVAVSIAVAATCKCAYGREFFAATWRGLAARWSRSAEPFGVIT